MAVEDWQQAMRRVRDALRQRGLTQTEIAAKMGVNPSNLSQWLNGRVEPKLGGFLALLEAAGMTLADLEQTDRGGHREPDRSGEHKPTLREALAQWIGEQVLEERLQVQPVGGGEHDAQTLARVVELIGAAEPEARPKGRSKSQEPS